MHSAQILKENCIEYIVLNSAKIISSNASDWQKFEDAVQPELLKVLVRKMMTDKHKLEKINSVVTTENFKTVAVPVSSRGFSFTSLPTPFATPAKLN